MTVVTFNTDVFPHVKNTVVDLSSDELARVDSVAKARGLSDVYTRGDHAEDNAEARAAADREAVKQNAIDQAAQLEAQRNAVPEPANVEALGITSEEPQVVTGTEPIDGVEVENPQEATDPGSGEGAKVKKKK